MKISEMNEISVKLVKISSEVHLYLCSKLVF